MPCIFSKLNTDTLHSICLYLKDYEKLCFEKCLSNEDRQELKDEKHSKLYWEWYHLHALNATAANLHPSDIHIVKIANDRIYYHALFEQMFKFEDEEEYQSDSDFGEEVEEILRNEKMFEGIKRRFNVYFGEDAVIDFPFILRPYYDNDAFVYDPRYVQVLLERVKYLLLLQKEPLVTPLQWESIQLFVNKFICNCNGFHNIFYHLRMVAKFLNELESYLKGEEDKLNSFKKVQLILRHFATLFRPTEQVLEKYHKSCSPGSLEDVQTVIYSFNNVHNFPLKNIKYDLLKQFYMRHNEFSVTGSKNLLNDMVFEDPFTTCNFEPSVPATIWKSLATGVAAKSAFGKKDPGHLLDRKKPSTDTFLTGKTWNNISFCVTQSIIFSYVPENYDSLKKLRHECYFPAGFMDGFKICDEMCYQILNHHDKKRAFSLSYDRGNYHFVPKKKEVLLEAQYNLTSESMVRKGEVLTLFIEDHVLLCMDSKFIFREDKQCYELIIVTFNVFKNAPKTFSVGFNRFLVDEFSSNKYSFQKVETDAYYFDMDKDYNTIESVLDGYERSKIVYYEENGDRYVYILNGWDPYKRKWARKNRDWCFYRIKLKKEKMFTPLKDFETASYIAAKRQFYHFLNNNDVLKAVELVKMEGGFAFVYTKSLQQNNAFVDNEEQFHCLYVYVVRNGIKRHFTKRLGDYNLWKVQYKNEGEEDILFLIFCTSTRNSAEFYHKSGRSSFHKKFSVMKLVL